MSNVYLIGCLHLGHKWMAEHRGFSSPEIYFQHLKDKWNKKINKKDLVYILGDVTMEKPEFYPLLNELKGRKKVILGNHDMGKDIPELLKYVETVEGMVHYKGYWLTHCPIHPQELTFVLGNIHAHIHEHEIERTELTVDYWDKQGIVISESNRGYYNVDAQSVNYEPVSLVELIPNLGKQEHFENTGTNTKMRGL